MFTADTVATAMMPSTTRITTPRCLPGRFIMAPQTSA